MSTEDRALRRPPVPRRATLRSVMDEVRDVRPRGDSRSTSGTVQPAGADETTRFVEALKAETDLFVDLRASGLRTLPGAVAPASIEALATVAGRRVLLGDRADPRPVVIEERVPGATGRGTAGPRALASFALHPLPPRIFDRRARDDARDGPTGDPDRSLARAAARAVRVPGTAAQLLALIRRCGRDSEALQVLVQVARDAFESGELSLGADVESQTVLELFEQLPGVSDVSHGLADTPDVGSVADRAITGDDIAPGPSIRGAAPGMDPLLRSLRGPAAVADTDDFLSGDPVAGDDPAVEGGEAHRQSTEAETGLLPGFVDLGAESQARDHEALSVNDLALAAVDAAASDDVGVGESDDSPDPIHAPGDDAAREPGDRGDGAGQGGRASAVPGSPAPRLGVDAAVPVLREIDVAPSAPASPMLAAVVREALEGGDGSLSSDPVQAEADPHGGRVPMDSPPPAGATREDDEARAGCLDPVHLRWASHAWALAGEDREASALCTLVAAISLVEMWTALDVTAGRCPRDEHWGDPLVDLLGYELALRLSERRGAWPDVLEAKRPAADVRPEATPRIRAAAGLLRRLGAVTRDRAVELRLDTQLKALRGDPVLGVGRFLLRRDWSAFADGLHALHEVPGVVLQWPDAHRHLGWTAHREELGRAAEFVCVLAVDARARRRAQRLRARRDGAVLVDAATAPASGRALASVGLVTCASLEADGGALRVSVDAAHGRRIVELDVAQYRETMVRQVRAWHVGDRFQTVFCVPLEAFDRLDSSGLSLPEGFHLACLDARCDRSWLDLVLDVLGCPGLLDADAGALPAG